MHTTVVILLGLVLLAVCLLVGRLIGGRFGLRMASLLFLPLWLVAAGVNMYVGVSRAGYTAAQETPILFLVFGVPAAAALGARRWMR